MSPPENFEKSKPNSPEKSFTSKKIVKEVKFSVKTSFVKVFSFLLSMKLAMQSAVH